MEDGYIRYDYDEVNYNKYKEEYKKTRDNLARLYIENFKKYLKDDAEFDYSTAGPKL